MSNDFASPLNSPNYPQLLAEWLTPAQQDAAPRLLRFTAADGRALAGSLFEPSQKSRAALLLGGATGVPRGFYDRYARWLAGQGYTVLSFDYRGIGDSRITPLARDPARMRDWGALDLPAALDELARRAPGLPLALIGHSVGGQMLGLMPNHARLAAAAMVATGIGSWRGMSPAYGLMVRGLIDLVGPALYRTLGYAPNSKIGWGEDLPRGVASDWFSWCGRRDYFAELRPAFFDAVRTPILSLRFPDDPIATAANVNGLLHFYPNARIEQRLVLPAEHGRRAIGHLHFFSSRMPQSLWRLPLEWIETQLHG